MPSPYIAKIKKVTTVKVNVNVGHVGDLATNLGMTGPQEKGNTQHGHLCSGNAIYVMGRCAANAKVVINGIIRIASPDFVKKKRKEELIIMQ